ncbi:MAG TPA: polysaccharide biosynthesis C-terminal domain-containing protein, partial [Pilimelia sp.]|nr:polysaccharide biosynthesis C-terminal domain-containing protein [Pilimelia sp.]
MSTRKLASASLANLLIPLSGLVVSPFLARELGPEGRGLYAALTLPIVVCGWLGTYGLQDSLTYHVRHGRLSRRGAAKVGLAAAVPLGVTGTALLAAVGLFIFADDRIHYGQFLVLALFAPLHILANLFIGALTGASDISGVNLVKVVPALLRTAVVIVACLAFDLSAFWAGLLFLASVAAGLAPGLARLWRNRPPTGGAAPSADVVPTTGRAALSDPTAATDESAVGGPAASAGYPVRSLVAYSLACLPGVLAAISSARLDQIVGLPVIGAEQLGYYAVAVSVAEIPLVIATAARTVLMGRPVAADPREATRAARFAVAASVVGCGLLAAAAPVAVPWVFGGAFAPAVLPAVILCAGSTLYTCVLIFTAVLLAGGRPGHSSAALVAGSILGIILLLVLAPLGAAGAAIASVCGYGVSLAVAAWAVRRTPQRLRMLTIPYGDDVRIARDVLRVRTHAAAGAAVTVVRRIGPANLAVAVLIVLAWLRVAAPSLVHMFTAGRPAFNSPDVVPAAADALGDAISLAFIAGAAALAASGIWRRTGPAGTRRPARLRWLAVVLAPLISIALAGLL